MTTSQWPQGFWKALGGIALVCGCGQEPAKAVASPSGAEGEAVRVGRFGLSLAATRRVAATGADGVGRWIESALVAEGLSRARPAYAAGVGRVALAQGLLGALLAEARGQGVPTEAEVGALAEERWWELARPRMVRVVHAVVLAKPPNEAARRHAGVILQKASGSRDPREFAERVKAIEHGDWEVKVEALPPVAPDGRALDPERPPPAGPRETHLVAPFARAAHALKEVGELSGIVETEFGYHVMFAVGFIERRMPDRKVLAGLLETEIYGVRATRLREALVTDLRGKSRIEPSRAAVTRMNSLTE